MHIYVNSSPDNELTNTIFQLVYWTSSCGEECHCPHHSQQKNKMLPLIFQKIISSIQSNSLIVGTYVNLSQDNELINTIFQFAYLTNFCGDNCYFPHNYMILNFVNTNLFTLCNMFY